MCIVSVVWRCVLFVFSCLSYVSRILCFVLQVSSVMFRADNARAKLLKTDNSGIMFSYSDGVNYGRLKEIFWHTYDTEAPPRAYGRIEWYTKIKTVHDGRMQLVKCDPQSHQNLNSNYEWLRLALAQNVACFPWDLRHQNKPELACIYRNSKNRDLDL